MLRRADPQAIGAGDPNPVTCQRRCRRERPRRATDRIASHRIASWSTPRWASQERPSGHSWYAAVAWPRPRSVWPRVLSCDRIVKLSNLARSWVIERRMTRTSLSHTGFGAPDDSFVHNLTWRARVEKGRAWSKQDATSKHSQNVLPTPTHAQFVLFSPWAAFYVVSSPYSPEPTKYTPMPPAMTQMAMRFIVGGFLPPLLESSSPGGR